MGPVYSLFYCRAPFTAEIAFYQHAGTRSTCTAFPFVLNLLMVVCMYALLTLSLPHLGNAGLNKLPSAKTLEFVCISTTRIRIIHCLQATVSSAI